MSHVWLPNITSFFNFEVRKNDNKLISTMSQIQNCDKSCILLSFTTVGMISLLEQYLSFLWLLR